MQKKTLHVRIPSLLRLYNGLVCSLNRMQLFLSLFAFYFFRPTILSSSTFYGTYRKISHFSSADYQTNFPASKNEITLKCEMSTHAVSNCCCFSVNFVFRIDTDRWPDMTSCKDSKVIQNKKKGGALIEEETYISLGLLFSEGKRFSEWLARVPRTSGKWQQENMLGFFYSSVHNLKN